MFRSNRTLGCHRLFTADARVTRCRSDGWGGWLRLGAASAHAHGRVRRLTGVWVFLSYDGRFFMRIALTGSQRWGERVYANLNRWIATTKIGNSEAARSVLVNGEGGLRWSFGSKDVHQVFLELPSSFSTDQLLRSVAENLNLWLPRVRRVLDLRPKIHTICGAIYRGF
jgi:hypothetical protein